MEELKSINKALGETAKFYQKYLNDSAPSDFKFHLSNGIDRIVKENAEFRKQLKDSHEWLGIDAGYKDSPLCVNNEKLLNK